MRTLGYVICPKCHEAMRTIARGSVHIDRCDNCKGVFLDGGELEQIIAAEQAHYATRPPAYQDEPGAPPPAYQGPADAPPPYQGPTDAPPAYQGPTGAPPAYQGPTGAPPAYQAPPPYPGQPGAPPAQPGTPPIYQPAPGTPAGPPPPVYPGGYQDYRHHPQKRRRSFLEELFD
ncbi:zf-TFIIB domain-containing protein [Actinosynnema sp. CA-248983]